MKITFLGGPCDGAESVLAEPLPPAIRGQGPSDDLLAEIDGASDAPVAGGSATYHLAHVDGRRALYVVAYNVKIPPGVNWSGVEEAKHPGQVFDRPL